MKSGPTVSLIVRRNDENLHGRRPNFRVLFDKENEITFGEVKLPSVPNSIVNQALIKLAEFMKGSLDSLHKQFDILQLLKHSGLLLVVGYYYHNFTTA